MKHARHHLQTILDPMIDFLEQSLMVVKCGLQMALVPLPFDSHAKDICRTLQERDVVLAEFSLGTAVDLQYAVW